MRGLEAVNFGNGAGHNDTHCIGHKVIFERVNNRLINNIARAQNMSFAVKGFCLPLGFLFWFFSHIFNSVISDYETSAISI